jgi:2-aminoadipate transaminase
MDQSDLKAPTWQLSERARKLTSSAIREILKVTERPEVISFAGGLPSPATFPAERMRAAADRILRDEPAAALQYSATEGFLPLREWVAKRYSVNGAQIRPTQVLITTGSQQALDLLGKVLVCPDSPVLVETPTYLGALQSFSMYEPRYVQVPTDEQGLVPEGLTPELTAGARLLYAQPNFQNPTGRRLPVERRRALAEFAKTAPFPVIEDDPYGALDYAGEPLPTMLSMAPDHIVHLGSFSKVLAPGLRVGYIIAPEELIFKLVQAKQATDLHTPSFTQRIVYEVIKDGFLDTHVPTIRELYRNQCAAMLASLERYMPEGVSWNRPEGGMFVWVNLPAQIDSMKLLEEAVAQNVAFVPGGPFFARFARFSPGPHPANSTTDEGHTMAQTNIYDRLEELGIELPTAGAPAAAYVMSAQSGNTVYLSGHIAKKDGKVWTGKLGATLTTEEGKAAARSIAIDLLATLHAHVGDLNRVTRIVKLMSLVNSTLEFTEQHLVTNGASELVADVFGERGKHARSAFGVAQIPLGACVEIEMIAEVE